jgi:acyl-CoA thioesterase-1
MSLLRFALLMLTGTLAGLAANPPAGFSGDRRNPALAPIVDDPKLPRVLLIGDSISIGYTLPAREALTGVANVHRIGENGGPTTNGLAKLDRWLGTNKWDVIHFNWGLHDLKQMTNGQHLTSTADYEQNLRFLVKKLKATGAKLLWASTTPVPEGKLSPPRRPGDVVEFNRAARRVMEENGVATDDLFAFAQPQLSEWQLPTNVHFRAEGSKRLANRWRRGSRLRWELPDYGRARLQPSRDQTEVSARL